MAHESVLELGPALPLVPRGCATRSLRVLLTERVVKLVPASCSLCLLCAACTHVAPVRHPSEFIAANAPPRVWVTQAMSDSVREVIKPHIAGDTLTGLVAGLEQHIPLGDLKEMDARQFRFGERVDQAACGGRYPDGTRSRIRATHPAQ